MDPKSTDLHPQRPQWCARTGDWVPNTVLTPWETSAWSFFFFFKQSTFFLTLFRAAQLCYPHWLSFVSLTWQLDLNTLSLTTVASSPPFHAVSLSFIEFTFAEGRLQVWLEVIPTTIILQNCEPVCGRTSSVQGQPDHSFLGAQRMSCLRGSSSHHRVLGNKSTETFRVMQFSLNSYLFSSI